MQEVYGEAAFDYIPRSYMLPAQYWVWRAWTQRTGSPAEVPWVLKANAHRGRGVRVMRQQQAQRQALHGGAVVSGADNKAQQQGYVLVQSYVRNQFLYDKRPSYLRLWVVVTSVQPLRLHLFRGGVVIFGDKVGSGRTGGGSGRQGIGGAGTAGVAAARRGGFGGNRGAAGAGLDDDGGGRRLRAAAAGEGRQDGKQQYETHQVNYWTIAGEKMPPWTLGQLRRHVAEALPADPGAFDRMWAHARASVGMVFASAARRMRSASRSLSALDGSGFEVLGVDFLLNATFHPTLVEVNAVPSMARLRTAPGDVQPSANATGAAADAAAAAADAALRPVFDLEKERFMHHTLRLVGIPLGPPPISEKTLEAPASPSPPPPAQQGGVLQALAGIFGGGGSGQDPAGGPAEQLRPRDPTPGGVLRALAALLRPSNNETTALQEYLRTHLPAAVAEAEAILPSLKPLLCPVPASWGAAPDWPVVQETVDVILGATAGRAGGGAAAALAVAGRRLAAAAAAGGTAAAEEAEGLGGAEAGQRAGADSRAVGGEGAVAGGRAVRTAWALRRHVPLGKVPMREAVGARARGAAVAGAALGVSAVVRTDGAREAAAGAAGAATGGAVLSAAEALAALRSGHMGRLGRAHVLGGAQGQGQGTQGGGAASAAGGGALRRLQEAASQAQAQPKPSSCLVKCFNWETLNMLADTEYELEQALDFDPVFPMAAAHELNAAALYVSHTHVSAAESQSGSDQAAAAGAAAVTPQTALQKLKTGLGFVAESIASVDLDLIRSMRYMTTTPYVLAGDQLPYSSLDSALASFEKARAKRAACGGGVGGGATEASGERGAAGACAMRVLQDTLAQICADLLASAAAHGR